MRALAVVPGRVKRRVATIVSLAVCALALFLFIFRSQPLIVTAVLLPSLSYVAYGGWCRWPRWRWGIASELLRDVPQPSTQTFRLTFDDGPTPGVTDRVLDICRERKIIASFFVLLPKARAAPDLIRRIVAEGHTLGLHGEDHRLPFGRSADELATSLARGRAELEALAGQPIALYRPSHGFKNRALIVAVRRAGLTFCFWDYGVWDTDAPPPSTLLARLRAATPTANEPQPGPVILLHDGKGDDPAIPAHATTMLAALAEWLGA